MTKNDITAARLDLIAAKAKILSEQYKNNQLWDGDLTRGLQEISQQIAEIGRGQSHERGGPGDR